MIAHRFTRTLRAGLQAAAAALLMAGAAAMAAVDANKASQAELETVKGIGPGLSAKILDARKAGPFASWADLVNRVGGVGQGNAKKLADQGLTVNGQSFDNSAAIASNAVKTPASSAKARTASASTKASPMSADLR